MEGFHPDVTRAVNKVVDAAASVQNTALPCSRPHRCVEI
jgi:hypothetical protein